MTTATPTVVNDITHEDLARFTARGKPDPDLGSRFHRWIGERLIGTPRDLQLIDPNCSFLYYAVPDRMTPHPNEMTPLLERQLLAVNIHRDALMTPVTRRAVLASSVACLVLLLLRSLIA